MLIVFSSQKKEKKRMFSEKKWASLPLSLSQLRKKDRLASIVCRWKGYCMHNRVPTYGVNLFSVNCEELLIQASKMCFSLDSDSFGSHIHICICSRSQSVSQHRHHHHHHQQRCNHHSIQIQYNWWWSFPLHEDKGLNQ